MNYSESMMQVANGILENFDEVYINAETVTNDKQVRFPAVALADEWVSLVPTDEREIIYIRRNSDDEVYDDLKISACAKSYKVRTLMRVVYFKDHAKNHAEIIRKLTQSVLVNGTSLRSVKQDKWQLLREETSATDYNFGASTAYFAIDVYLLWLLSPENCEEDPCPDIVNPLKKESCLAVV